MYIETVIDIHKKFLVLVQEAFAGEQGFTAALDKVEQKKMKTILYNLCSFVFRIGMRKIY